MVKCSQFVLYCQTLNVVINDRPSPSRNVVMHVIGTRVDGQVHLRINRDYELCYNDAVDEL